MNLHRLAEERSLAIHREIAQRLRSDASVVDRARAALGRWTREGRISQHYARAWASWLARSPQEVATLLVDEGEQARALRQCSPFVGIVDPRRRWEIWQSVKARCENG